jgi:hypothetical protein
VLNPRIGATGNDYLTEPYRPPYRPCLDAEARRAGSGRKAVVSSRCLLFAQGERRLLRAAAMIADRRGRRIRFDWCGMLVHLMSLADWFAEQSARGVLTRMVGAWLIVGLPVIAARLWWSVAAAIAVFLGAVTIYVAAAVRYMHRHHRRP